MMFSNSFKSITDFPLLIKYSFIAFYFSLVGCANSSNEDITPVSGSESIGNPPTFDDLPREDYTDPEQFNEPRLMFMQSLKGKEDAVWSMKLDGSDVRLIVSSEHLYEENRVCCVTDRLARSPDNRYIAIALRHNEGRVGRYLIDLKRRVVKQVGYGRNIASFTFTEDSKILFFKSDFDIWEYNISTGERSKHVNFERPNLGFFLINDDQAFLVITVEGYDIYRRQDFSLLKRFEMPEHAGDSPAYWTQHFAVSPNRCLIAVSSYGVNGMIDRCANDEVIPLPSELLLFKAIVFNDRRVLVNTSGGLRQIYPESSDQIAIPFESSYPSPIRTLINF